MSASSDSWCRPSQLEGDAIIEACYNHSQIDTRNTADTVASGSVNANIYSYGNYYNWYSATAGNGTYQDASGNTEGDICPKNWQLPVGGHSTTANPIAKGYSQLSVSMGGTGWHQNDSGGNAQISKMRTYPNNFVRSGQFPDYNPEDQTRGGYGAYWTSTATSASSTASLYLYTNSFQPASNNNTASKTNGATIRCVAK